MSTETVARGAERRHRLDSANIRSTIWSSQGVRAAIIASVAVGFVVVGGVSLSPYDDEARLALSAYGEIGPYAQVLGGYDTEIAPAAFWLTKLTVWLGGGTPSEIAVRAQACLAGLAIGFLLMRRMSLKFGPRVGLCAFLAFCGSIGMIDHTSKTGLNLPLCLALFGTLDRILTKGSDWVAGVLAACVVLLGGWPALAMVLLPLIVIGRHGASASIRLLLPPLLALAAWSTWALMTVRAEVWAATLTLPLTRGVQLSVGFLALVSALPWAPLALSLLPSSSRSGWNPIQRQFVADWAKVAVVGLLAGTVLPGLATAGTALVFLGLVVVSAVAIEKAWTNALGGSARAIALVTTFAIAIVLAAWAVFAGALSAFCQPYYRGVGIAMIVLGTIVGILAVDSIWTRSGRSVIRALVMVAVTIKLAYFGSFVPELNYRFGKGPWGRAIGQYVPPGWPIYTLHPVNPALALATEHPMRQIRAEIFLTAQPGDGPKFVLLEEAEFEHWPESAPKIQKVRAFESEYGGIRVLARTPGRLQRPDMDK